MLTPEELVALADQMVAAKDTEEADRLQKQILAGFGVDVDAVAGWLGSYGGEDSPMDISRGLSPVNSEHHVCSGF